MTAPRRSLVLALAAAATLVTACATEGAPPADPGGAPRARPSRRELRAACGDDYRRLCADVPRGDGRIAACFQAHAAELSPRCRDTLAAAGPQRP